jgi:hypothetical protein
MRKELLTFKKLKILLRNNFTTRRLAVGRNTPGVLLFCGFHRVHPFWLQKKLTMDLIRNNLMILASLDY